MPAGRGTARLRRLLARTGREWRTQTPTLLLALGWIAAFLAADISTRRQDVVLAVLFAVAPLIASAAVSWPTTALFGALATGLAIASPAWDPGTNAVAWAVRVVDVAIISAAAVAISQVRVARERRLSKVVQAADTAQRAVLPAVPARVGPLRVATRYRSAAEDALVGGDLYDAVEVGNHSRLVVGDVRGKGLGALAHAARTIRAFRLYAGLEPELSAVAARTSAAVAPELQVEDFVTAVFVDAAPDGEVRVVGCGHPPPLLHRADGTVEWLPTAACPPLGVAERFGRAPVPDEHRIRLRPGDWLLLYTDGLTEVRDAQGRFFSPAALVRRLGDAGPEEILDRLLAAVDAHLPPEGHLDDIALVLLQLAGPLRRPDERVSGRSDADA